MASVELQTVKKALGLTWAQFMAALYLAGGEEDVDISVFTWGAWLTKAAADGNTVTGPEHFLKEATLLIAEELAAGTITAGQADSVKELVETSVALLPKLLQEKPETFSEIKEKQAIPATVPVLVKALGRQKWLYLNRVYDLEGRLITGLKRCIDFSGKLNLEKRTVTKIRKSLFAAMTSFALNEQQTTAWNRAMESNFTVVCGGPGTGKTTLIVSILRGLVLAQNRLRIAVCAPTGRAVFRVKESINQAVSSNPLSGVLADSFLNDIQYATIHRLLGLGFDRRIHAKYNALNPLPYDVILLDEASMVDLELLTYFLEAKANPTKLIILGDPEQLPSVGMGTVLKDLTETQTSRSHILRKNIVRLTQSHRAEGILEHLTAAMASKDSVLFEELITKNDPALNIYDVDAGFDLNEYLMDYYPIQEWTDRAQQNVHIDSDVWLEDAKSLMNALNQKILLCPFRRGEWGSEKINDFYGELYKSKFRQNSNLLPGMPLMVTRNDYDLGLFNGDRGFVMSFNNERYVVFPGESDDLPFKIVKLERLFFCEPAFAMTVHKSQGSEFDTVAFLVAPDREIGVYRELSYTALTRAKRKIEFAGRASGLWPMLIRPNSRLSALTDRLKQS